MIYMPVVEYLPALKHVFPVRQERQIKRMNSPKHTVGVVADEDVARLRARSGTTSPVMQNNEAATKDAIRHFADGMGDPNPLWRNEQYASGTRYGCLIAPPTFLNAIAPAQWTEGLSNAIRFVAGCEWEWFKNIRVNDTFKVTNTFEDIVVKRAEPVGQRLFLQSGRMKYCNQRNETVGVCRWSTMWAEFGDKRQQSISDKLKEPARYVYSEQELKAIERAYNEEKIKGANPRYWENVVVGEELKPVIKGPVTHADMVAFVVGIGWLGQAHALSPHKGEQHRGWQIANTGVFEPGVGVHFLDEVARGLTGEPFAFNLGIQRVCWLGHLMTNWMGDDGFLKKLNAQFRKVSYLGDTDWCRGKVVNKYMKDREHLVECEVWCENQKGEKNTLGHATVLLPSRNTTD